MGNSEDSRMPIRISICIPLYGGASAVWVSSAFELIFSFLADPSFEVQVLTNHSCPVSHARNQMLFQLKEQRVKSGWVPDFVLWVDSDNLVTKEKIRALASDDCDIVSALYFKKKDPFLPVAMQAVPGKINKRHMADYRKGELQEADFVGMGCCLMKWGVIEKVMESHTHPFDFKAILDDSGKPNYLSEDFVFCERAREKGFKIFLDARVVSGHIGGVVDGKGGETGCPA